MPIRSCPQLVLIDAAARDPCWSGVKRMNVVLPEAKDPHTTAHWIEQCLAGNVPVPHALKLQMACCLLATGEVESVRG